MSQFAFLQTADGQLIKVRVSDDGVLQSTVNGSDFLDMPAGGTGNPVQSVTSATPNAVNNTDPTAPVINDSTATNAGTMSAADFITVSKTVPYAQGADLADADATITPGTSKKAQYVMRAGTTTAARNVTVDTASISNAQTCDLVIFAQADNVVIKTSSGGGTLKTVTAGDAMRVVLYFNVNNWILSTWAYV